MLDEFFFSNGKKWLGNMPNSYLLTSPYGATSIMNVIKWAVKLRKYFIFPHDTTHQTCVA
jgi:hypothetical protein